MRRHLWLVLFTALTVATHLRYGLGALAWIAAVPALIWLRGVQSWRGQLVLLGVGCLAWTLAVLKIVTAPLVPALAPVFGVPIALCLTVPMLAYDVLRRRGVGPWAFPVLMIGGEWVQHTLTPFASWGAIAYTQADQLPLMQLAALGGLSAIGFVVHAVAAVIDHAWAHGWVAARRHVWAAAGLVLLAYAGGHARIAAATATPTQMMRIAMIDTDSGAGGLPLPTPAQAATWDATLVARTEAAAAAGATLVVWPEAAGLVRAEDEAQWRAARADDARRLNIDLVAAFVTPVATDPLRYENRYAWFGPDGALEHVYRKRFPVPGEPAIAGDAPAPLVERGAARLSGAICYDFDFPQLAKAHGARAVDVVVLPSSDWRGIDPIHTQMAAFRAIEGGFSLIRATRFGLSAAIDATGRMRAWNSAFEASPGFTIADVPAANTPTLFARLGDWPVAVGLLWLLGAFLRRRRLDRAAPAR